jgi:hypothetical protein
MLAGQEAYMKYTGEDNIDLTRICEKRRLKRVNKKL